MTLAERKKCFIIMPFSTTTKEHTEDYWTKHYEKFLKPLIEVNPSLKAFRSAPLKGDILRQIITDLIYSPIVVADLTDKNPNVFWELGVRQSFKHCTIIIAEVGTDLPFDIQTNATLFYSNNEANNLVKSQKFISAFHAALTECLNNPLAPDSLVLETISGRGSLFQILNKEETMRKLRALTLEIQNNSVLLESVKEVCENNAKSRKGNKSFPTMSHTQRFRFMAADSLWVNRYIDTDDSFYSSLDTYIRGVLAYNETLAVWSSEPANMMVPTERWLIEKYETLKTSFTKIEQLAKQQWDKISLYP